MREESSTSHINGPKLTWNCKELVHQIWFDVYGLAGWIFYLTLICYMTKMCRHPTITPMRASWKKAMAINMKLASLCCYRVKLAIDGSNIGRYSNRMAWLLGTKPQQERFSQITWSTVRRIKVVFSSLQLAVWMKINARLWPALKVRLTLYL